MPSERHDRVIDWEEELLRIAPNLLELPQSAREAVYQVLAGFLHEDAGVELEPMREPERISQAA
jgi:hypothetical protein